MTNAKTHTGVQAYLNEFMGSKPLTVLDWLSLSRTTRDSLRSGVSVDAISDLQNCHRIRENIMKAIETDSTLQEDLLADLFLELEALNTLL